MLVLTRKIGEEIIIDGAIRVTVTMIKGDKVRIGITAPPEIRVDRAEIFERLREFAETNESFRAEPSCLASSSLAASRLSETDVDAPVVLDSPWRNLPKNRRVQ